MRARWRWRRFSALIRRLRGWNNSWGEGIRRRICEQKVAGYVRLFYAIVDGFLFNMNRTLYPFLSIR